MKINETNPLRPAGAGNIRRKPGASGTSFSDLLDGMSDAESATATTETAAPTAMGAVLAVQEMPEENYRRKKASARAGQVLDQLEQLRTALLTGRVPAYVLRNLSNILAEHRERLADPELTRVIDDIELRAAVELAKLEMAQATPKG